MNIVYLKLDRHIQITNPVICIGDLGDVYCNDKAVETSIREMEIFHLDRQPKQEKHQRRHKNQRKVASIMEVISIINEKTDSGSIMIQNVGETEFVMDLIYDDHKKRQKQGHKQSDQKCDWIKIAGVSLLTFFGSIFAIMTYNEDVGVTGVFEKVNDMMAAGSIGLHLMEVAYGAGIMAGILIFFNHFGHRPADEPTPMEVEMEKYEADLEDTMIKEVMRKEDNQNN